MADSVNRFAAELLQKGCRSFGGYAASALLESHPEVAARIPNAFENWKTHLAQRALELAAAVRSGEAALFSARVRWTRKAVEARNGQTLDLRWGLEALRDVLAERLPENACAPTLEYLQEGLSAFDKPLPLQDPDQELDPTSPEGRLALSYLQKILTGDAEGAIDDIVGAVSGGLPVQDAYLRVLLPAEREIGRLWHAAEVSVAEEHLVTFAIQRTMAVLADRFRPDAEVEKTVIVAAVERNAHDIGLRAASDLFRFAGWRTIFLGADVPAGDLAAMLTFFDADILLLGASMTEQLADVSRTIAIVRECCERRVPIVVGGGAFEEGSAELWRTMGADAYAGSLSDALEVGRRLLRHQI